MTNLYYFKVAFLSVSAGMTVGMIVYGLFDMDYNNESGIAQLFLRSIATGVVVGLVMGVLNIFFKLKPVKKTT